MTQVTTRNLVPAWLLQAKHNWFAARFGRRAHNTTELNFAWEYFLDDPRRNDDRRPGRTDN